MPSLSTIDFVLIFAYFVVLIGIGYWTSRRQKDEDFLIAERKLGTWRTMATMNASKSGSILMAFVAMVYLWGFSAVWYFIGVVIGIILFIPFAMRLKEKSKQRFYTLADYFRYNYGKKAAVFASILSIFLMFGLAVVSLTAGANIFMFFTAWPFWICAIIMALVILAYLVLGGFRAVAKTDILQYIAMILILFFLVLILFNGSLIPASEWKPFSTDLFSIIGFFVVGVIYPFASPDLWQRVYSSKGKKQLRNGLILSVIIYTFMGFLLSLIALTVKVNFPLVNPELALIHGFANMLPAGLVGLSMVLLFAAIMSSLDTYIYTGSSASVQDFCKWDKKKIVKSIKKVLLIFTGVVTLIGIIIGSLTVSTYIFVSFYAAISIPILATWIRSKIKQETLIFGFAIGVFGLIASLIITLSRGEVTPIIVVAAVVSSIAGLLIGGIVSYFKHK